MPKAPSEKTLAELAADMHTRAEGLTHLMAKAEIELRRTEAQLRATTYMLVASIAAAVPAGTVERGERKRTAAEVSKSEQDHGWTSAFGGRAVMQRTARFAVMHNAA